MLRKVMKRVLFGKKRNYERRNKRAYKYVTWHQHNLLMSRVDNLISHLKLEKVGNHSLIGDKKVAKKFNNQYDY